MTTRARIRAGDPEAFGDLFDQFARDIYNYAFRLTGSWSTADEIVALTFLEAWRLRGRVDPDGASLRPWLYGIATNVARNTTRAARRHVAALSRLPTTGHVPDFADDLVERIDDTRTIARVREALATLRPAEQDVIQLCVLAGMDYASAADALGLPIGTVRSRLSRARRKLHALLGPEIGEPEPPTGQIPGDRDTADQPAQEMPR